MLSRCATSLAQVLANLKSLSALYIVGKLCLCCPPESIHLVSKNCIGLNHVSPLSGTF